MNEYNNNNNVKDSLCANHKKNFKLICYKCNYLLCSKCNNEHLQSPSPNNSTSPHKCVHIDSIKLNLDHFFENLVVGVEPGDHQSSAVGTPVRDGDDRVKDRVSELWNVIRKSTKSMEVLESDELRIEQHFAKLFNFLILEEQKMKEAIRDDMGRLATFIKDSLVELRHFFNIYKLNKENQENPANYHSQSSQSQEVDSASPVGNVLPLSPNRIRTMEPVPFKELLNSIKECQSLLDFYNMSNRDVEEPQDVDLSQEHEDNEDNDLDGQETNIKGSKIDPILHMIHSYNEKYDVMSLPKSLILPKYVIDCNDDFKAQFGDKIRSSIVISTLNPEDLAIQNRLIQQKSSEKIKIQRSTAHLQGTLGLSIEELSRALHPEPKKQYIFSTNNGCGATLVDITSHNDFRFENIEHFFSSEYTFNSVVAVGDNVYVFGGGEDAKNQNKYYRFSLKSKYIVKGDICGISGGRSISACYDGGEYIYLVNGRNSDSELIKRIDRFKLHTMSFEKFFEFKSSDSSNHIVSFYYKNELFTMDEKQVYIFNPATKSISKFNPKVGIIHGACTDSDGTIYFLTKSKDEDVSGQFVKFDIATRRHERLKIDDGILFGDSLLYRKVSSTESYIYMIGGSSSGNYIYSIEDNEWRVFYEDDLNDRELCGSAIIQ